MKQIHKLNQIDRKAIEVYLFPELENIKALLEGLNLRESLIALVLLQNILQNELKKHYY